MKPAGALRTLLLGLLVAGCSLYGPERTGGAVEVEALPGYRLEVTNATARAIYYVAFPARLLPLIDWAPTLNEDHRIAAGARREVGPVGTEEADRDVVFFWWHARRTACKGGVEGDGMCLEPGPVHRIDVRR